MTSWANDNDDESPELVSALARADLAARWFLRNGAPSPDHYRDVMEALAATELVDQARPLSKPL